MIFLSVKSVSYMWDLSVREKSGVKKCLEICAIKGGGGGHLMANAILNFHFDFLHPSLSRGAQCWSFRCFCVGIILYFHHHRHFAFVNFCGSLMAGDNESCVCQGKQKCLLSKLGICTAKFDVCSIPFVFSTLEHWTLNVQCSMFNVQC